MPEIDYQLDEQKAFIITAPYDRDLTQFEETLRLFCTQQQVCLTIPKGKFVLRLDADSAAIQGAIT